MTDEVKNEVTSESTDSTEKTTTEKKSNEAKSVALSTFVGMKRGMTRIYGENGAQTPVTVIELLPNYVTQVKTSEKDGYSAYQIGYAVKRDSLAKKPVKSKLEKNGVAENVTKFQEVKADTADSGMVGAKLAFDNFQAGTAVDITGTSKGKGFQGVIKRYNFSGGPMAHGSKFHRAPGSIGNCASPGKVVKGKKLPGHMGAKKVTVQNLEVVEVNTEKGYMLIKGAVPGSKNNYVKVSTAIKKAAAK